MGRETHPLMNLIASHGGDLLRGTFLQAKALRRQNAQDNCSAHAVTRAGRQRGQVLMLGEIERGVARRRVHRALNEVTPTMGTGTVGNAA